MRIETKLFGTIDINAEKIIVFPQGIIGFPELKAFTLIFDSEKASGISWLQSMDEPGFALPVMDPLLVCDSYNPMVESELLNPLGEFADDDMLVLVTVTVPSELKKLSVNLQAPIVINAGTLKGTQLIVDDSEGNYPVKYMIYEILKNRKESEGE